MPGMGFVQLAKPKSHVDTQSVPMQTRDAVFVPAHVRPHAPQLKTSSTTTVSHPSSAMGAMGETQLPCVASHVGAHLPAVHAVLTALAPEQTYPHVPQFADDVCKLTSHPSIASLLQSPKPLAQFNPHMPFVHVAVELGPLGHALPHIPQFDTVRMSTSHPFPGIMSQSAKSAMQDSTVHMPMVHSSLAFARLHTLLQKAQSCAVTMDVSQPSAGLLLQSAVPAPQGLFLHMLFEHVWNALHLFPHAPQLFGSV
jgi:hypothetical protein